ncbi:DNA-binding protein WhiA [Gemmiger gallinarum]|uniref:DNA-binding protein WhiA n=1 Tax=Gemmiger gallinarum TaxID=2779354 RepID=UPI001F208E68|nr:DNA-binding protein WhiA [Gemmiger gallinarum]
MSFSQDVKNEILRRKIQRPCCTQAAAYAVACFGKYFDDRGVVLQTEHEGIANLARKLYERCGIQGTVLPKERSSGTVYEFSVKDPEEVRKMLELFGHTGRETALRIRPECFVCRDCVSHFLSTAFLCCGTATDPEKGYTLEFLSTRYHVSRQLEAILSEHDFRPHRTLRKGANVVYIKASDQIEDLLTFMGAGGAAMRVMEQRMYNDMRNRTNRLSNCETANLGKSVQAAVQVQMAIRTLQEAGALETLPEQLRETARLRMEYPDLTLARLAEKFDPPVSKAGLSHRFKRIQEAARRLEAAGKTAPRPAEKVNQ